MEVKQNLEYALSEKGQDKIKRDYVELRTILSVGGASKKTAQYIIDALN